MREFSSATDITITMGTEMRLYPGDSPLIVRRLSSIEAGASLTASELVLGCHLGTHVDAPSHFVAGGAALDDLDLSHFYGAATVLDLTGRDRITAEDVRQISVPARRHILLKTRNSELLCRRKFEPNYCYVLPEVVERLLGFQPLSLGFDYYSFDPLSENLFPAHLAIARAGLPAFVCLDLLNVSPGEYLFVALPLKVPQIEGVPVRAMLFGKQQPRTNSARQSRAVGYRKS